MASDTGESTADIVSNRHLLHVSMNAEVLQLRSVIVWSGCRAYSSCDALCALIASIQAPAY
jgi:hypothetical protein